MTMLAGPESDLACVADDDQGIYGWNVTHVQADVEPRALERTIALLDQVETILRGHVGPRPPHETLLALCRRAFIAPAVTARPELPDLLSDLAADLAQFASAREYLASAHLESSSRDKAIEPGGGDKVLVMTTHTAKGLEAPIVFLPG